MFFGAATCEVFLNHHPYWLCVALTSPNSIYFTGIAVNMTVAKAAFQDAWQWESYLPSLLSPFTPPVKAPIDHPVREFRYFSSFVAMDTLFYRENTLGVAPFFALTYLRIVSYFHGPSPVPGPLEDPSSVGSTLDRIMRNTETLFQKLLSNLSSVLDAVQGYLSESDRNSLQALGTTFLVLLLTLALRLYGRGRRHWWDVVSAILKLSSLHRTDKRFPLLCRIYGPGTRIATIAAMPPFSSSLVSYSPSQLRHSARQLVTLRFAYISEFFIALFATQTVSQSTLQSQLSCSKMGTGTESRWFCVR